MANVVDYVTQKSFISDTTLRSFLPRQVRKMTPKTCHIFGYDICIIPKDMQIDLNRFRTRLVIYLQHKSVGRHTCTSAFSNTSAKNYKKKVFPDGEFLHDTIKDTAQCISCTNIKPNNMIHIKCDLGFCDECTE